MNLLKNNDMETNFCIYIGASLYWDINNERATSLTPETRQDVIIDNIGKARMELSHAMKYLNDRGSLIQASYKIALKRIKTINEAGSKISVEFQEEAPVIQTALFPEDCNQCSLFQ